MDKQDKLDKTVLKTIEALNRIQRFVIKFRSSLNEKQTKQIFEKVQELQNNIHAKI